MPDVSLNKSEMTRLGKQLKTYKKFVPSLDMKRKQIIVQRNKARDTLLAAQDDYAKLEERIRKNYPMMAHEKMDASNLIIIKDVRLSEENIVGTRVPKFEALEITTKDFGRFGVPFWLDMLITDMRDLTEQMLRIKVFEERLSRLDYALIKTTQRLNLFDKVLIPQTQAHIKKIKIFLSDQERAAVIQAKIAKSRSVAVREAELAAEDDLRKAA